MSRVDELIMKLCPKGVQRDILGAISTIKTGASVSKKAIEANPGKYPVINSGREPLGHIGVFNTENDPLGITSRGAGVGSITWREGRYFRGNLNYSVTVRNSSEIEVRYLYHLLLLMQKDIQALCSFQGIPALNKFNLEKLVIPVPPIEVQREIVRILDEFSKLEARKRQYEHYCHELTEPFDGDRKLKVGWKSVELGEICRIKKGKTPIQKAIPGRYPLVATSSERQSSDSFQFDTDAVCVPLISSKGHGVASLSRIYYQSGQFALGSILCAVIPEDPALVSAEFLYYFLSSRKDVLLVSLMRGGANVSLTVNSLKTVSVQFPSIEEQIRIVRVLRKFDVFLEDTESGLPTEILARRQQYEYYRDKLLTFKELEVLA